jgi:hypothetical protein
MSLPVMEIYSSIECPFAYLAVYRLRQVWHEYEGRVGLAWRTLSLEWVNQQSYALPLFEVERGLFNRLSRICPGSAGPDRRGSSLPPGGRLLKP